jgi:hypothetical protein
MTTKRARTDGALVLEYVRIFLEALGMALVLGSPDRPVTLADDSISRPDAGATTQRPLTCSSRRCDHRHDMSVRALVWSCPRGV